MVALREENVTRYLSPEEIRAYQPDPPLPPDADPIRHARQIAIETGQWTPRQMMGRRWAVGCVALEITQRCNLDCTLCYLSDHAEAVKDLPLPEIWRRIDLIHAMYGPGTNVQVTGGDPTLRKRSELVAIVRRVRERGMNPTLFTNGIKATRDLLVELRDAGLVDVAFHVDTTQERKGYKTEADLHAVRRDYIERARGLGLAVYFNTTVHDGNFHEVPEVARFFVRHSDVVDLASFQLQADTGRGTQRERGALISIETVAEQIQAGVQGRLDFAGNSIGHTSCNRYAMNLAVNNRLYNLFEGDFLHELLDRTAEEAVWVDRTRIARSVGIFAGYFARNPRLTARGLRWVASMLWRMRHDLVAARGRVSSFSFFIHNFMDASCLDCERIKACSFKVVTADGPISMCLHNAKRDEMILKPIRVQNGQGQGWWDPLTGRTSSEPPAARRSVLPVKLLKGRAREVARSGAKAPAPEQAG